MLPVVKRATGYGTNRTCLILDISDWKIFLSQRKFEPISLKIPDLLVIELKNKFNYFSRNIYLRQATVGVTRVCFKNEIRKASRGIKLLNQLVKYWTTTRTSLDSLGDEEGRLQHPWLSDEWETHTPVVFYIIVHNFIENFECPVCYFDHSGCLYMIILFHSVKTVLGLMNDCLIQGWIWLDNLWKNVS